MRTHYHKLASTRESTESNMLERPQHGGKVVPYAEYQNQVNVMKVVFRGNEAAVDDDRPNQVALFHLGE